MLKSVSDGQTDWKNVDTVLFKGFMLELSIFTNIKPGKLAQQIILNVSTKNIFFKHLNFKLVTTALTFLK